MPATRWSVSGIEGRLSYFCWLYLLKKSSKRTIYEKAAFTEIKKNKLSGKENISAFVYGMALHTAADIFSHSAAGVKGQDRKKLKKKSVKSLAKMWNTLKHGPKDNKGHFNPKKTWQTVQHV